LFTLVNLVHKPNCASAFLNLKAYLRALSFHHSSPFKFLPLARIRHSHLRPGFGQDKTNTFLATQHIFQLTLLLKMANVVGVIFRQPQPVVDVAEWAIPVLPPAVGYALIITLWWCKSSF
jgi:hypothetical protein